MQGLKGAPKEKSKNPEQHTSAYGNLVLKPYSPSKRTSQDLLRNMMNEPRIIRKKLDRAMKRSCEAERDPGRSDGDDSRLTMGAGLGGRPASASNGVRSVGVFDATCSPGVDTSSSAHWLL